MSVTTNLFKSNRTQAVRLPKDVAFDDDVTEVEITVVGDVRVIRPVEVNPWAAFEATTMPLGDDYPDRDQPADQERGWL